MIGRYKKCLVVLPKPSCYVYKDNDTKRVINQNINKWVGYLKNLNEELPIVAYAEDALQKLFSVTDNLVYVLGNADTTFVSNNMLEEFPDRYIDECSDDKKIDEKIYGSIYENPLSPCRMHISCRRGADMHFPVCQWHSGNE